MGTAIVALSSGVVTVDVAVDVISQRMPKVDGMVTMLECGVSSMGYLHVLKEEGNLIFGCNQSNSVGHCHDISVRMMQSGWLPREIRLQITQLDQLIMRLLPAIAHFEDNVDSFW